nr:zinc finger, CCHC-type [Tanacetum cinerariifolium]
MATVLTSMDATSILTSGGVQVVPTAVEVATATGFGGGGYLGEYVEVFDGMGEGVSGSRVDGYDNADVMAMSVEELLDRIMDLGGSYHITYKRDYLVDFEEYDGGNILLGAGKECCVRGTGDVQVQMRNGLSFLLDNVRYVSILM